MAATLNRNKQVEAANARVTALEGELAACNNKTAGLGEEAKGKEGETELIYRVVQVVVEEFLLTAILKLHFSSRGLY